MSLVAPAVLPSSREEFEGRIALFTQWLLVSRVQIDVVDGKFASPASWPYTAPQELHDRVARSEFLPALERITYEIDLMCLNAERAVGAWVALGASRFTFHAESMTDISQSLTSVHAEHGRDVATAGLIACGLALNIESDLALIEPALHYIDYVQFMGIARIGRQGQPFDVRVLEKIRVFHKRHPEIPLQVDGGVSLDNAEQLLSLGVSTLIVGSSILRSSDPVATLKAFEDLETSYGV